MFRKVGYFRADRRHQAAESTVSALREAGCTEIIEEAPTRGSRLQQLTALIDGLAPGDVLVVTRLVQLGTTLGDILECIEKIDSMGAMLHALDEGLDTATAEGRTVIKIFGLLASVNHELFSERAHNGHVTARMKGQKVGRPRSLGKEDREAVLLAIRSQGQTVEAVADRFGVNERTIYRILNSAQGNAGQGRPKAG